MLCGLLVDVMVMVIAEGLDVEMSDLKMFSSEFALASSLKWKLLNNCVTIHILPCMGNSIDIISWGDNKSFGDGIYFFNAVKSNTNKAYLVKLRLRVSTIASCSYGNKQIMRLNCFCM